jgi:hypothetical protein
MSGSSQAGQQMLTNQTDNGNIPQISRSYTFSIVLASGIAQTIDLRSLQNSSQFRTAQGMFVDNSANGVPCVVTLPSGQAIQVPAYNQGTFPIYLPMATPVLTFSGNGSVGFVLINFPTPACFWSLASSTFSFNGNNLQVYDSQVAGLISSAEGSLSGGTTATVSLAFGGVFGVVPLLTTGQQAAAALSAQGALKIAQGGQSSSLNVTSSTNVKASAGRVGKVIVNVAPTSTAYVLDSTGTTQSAANTLLVIPSGTVAGTVFNLDFPAQAGISLIPSGGTLAISYD